MSYKIERLDDFGRGITRINGKVCFVSNALKDEENINFEQINSLFAERRDIEEKIKKAFNDMCKVNEKANAISKAFESLKNPIDAYCN